MGVRYSVVPENIAQFKSLLVLFRVVLDVPIKEWKEGGSDEEKSYRKEHLDGLFPLPQLLMVERPLIILKSYLKKKRYLTKQPNNSKFSNSFPRHGTNP